MNKEEAIKIVEAKFPDQDIDKVTETEKYFLISILPKQKNPKVLIRPVPKADGLMAVDKASKKVFTYNPIRHGK